MLELGTFLHSVLCWLKPWLVLILAQGKLISWPQPSADSLGSGTITLLCTGGDRGGPGQHGDSLGTPVGMCQGWRMCQAGPASWHAAGRDVGCRPAGSKTLQVQGGGGMHVFAGVRFILQPHDVLLRPGYCCHLPVPCCAVGNPGVPAPEQGREGSRAPRLICQLEPRTAGWFHRRALALLRRRELSHLGSGAGAGLRPAALRLGQRPRPVPLLPVEMMSWQWFGWCFCCGLGFSS